ncbi:MAG: hypothetical protein JNL98_01510 [Bryobacterales bacterium]|nr:hypothetical protein [Bryobacterales bacterium]
MDVETLLLSHVNAVNYTAKLSLAALDSLAEGAVMPVSGILTRGREAVRAASGCPKRPEPGW